MSDRDDFMAWATSRLRDAEWKVTHRQADTVQDAEK